MWNNRTSTLDKTKDINHIQGECSHIPNPVKTPGIDPTGHFQAEKSRIRKIIGIHHSLGNDPSHKHESYFLGNIWLGVRQLPLFVNSINVPSLDCKKWPFWACKGDSRR